MTDNTQTILSSTAQALKLKKYTLSTPFEAHKQSFQKRLIYIGSHPDSDFCLAEPSISRQHAKLELDETGCRLVDLGSKNGTFIGDIRINDIYLTNHTTFRCGAVEITFDLQSDTFEVAISKDDHFGRMIRPLTSSFSMWNTLTEFSMAVSVATRWMVWITIFLA
ncbi:MAG: FHA domain-containing protein [Proteobacteria bacterium]|nr:FHA domain-containing protein [Pseudomonadota bacterium]